jgi:RNA-directed DNA polymerase
MKEGQAEKKPSAVSKTATQEGEIRARWAWTEPSVWTERMLTALEDGVKGGKWFSLIDKVYAEGNLKAAARKVIANKGSAGVDRQSVVMFNERFEENVAWLEKELRAGTYQPQPILRTYIPKPGSQELRPLGVPTIGDRTVQGALRNVLEPIFEQEFADHSYGFRPGRGCKDALRRVDALLKAGYHYVVDADLKSYFDTIPHDRLLEQIKEKVSDGRVLELVEAYLNQKVMEGTKGWTPESGTPQGAVISPLLSNIYLDPLDHLIAAKGYEITRYADDFVILCRTREKAEKALELVREWTVKAGLILHPEKTKIVDAMEEGGFDFLGYHFERGRKRPRKKSLKKFQDTIRLKTKRSSGYSLEFIIANVNSTIIGWFGYFKHSHWRTFKDLDGWVRGRLRNILRRRMRKRGRASGRDHQRWPNAFFAEHGLYSLATAHAVACQSSRR